MDGLAAAAGVLPVFVIVGLVVWLTTRAAERPARWCAVVCGGLRWSAVVCGVSAVVLLGPALAGGGECRSAADRRGVPPWGYPAGDDLPRQVVPAR
ncbi:hypothetical protein OG218_13305 [Kineococcus sp. NBC_00420]|uniref:hypothetical protein n=1 Tax=Kineococcus sp. NBC_00420 TaxID=2903564 RepID=UPI002E1B2AC2